MIKSFLYSLLALLLLSSAPIDKTPYKTIAGKTVFEIKEKKVFVFSSGLMIDADGSPHAYGTDTKVALDFLSNAGKPGNWWALVTDNGKASGNPVIQTDSDPAPGFYISMTALEDQTKATKDPQRYVNSETVPYIVLPGNFSKEFTLGDIALVINKAKNRKCFAIFADIGPDNKIGEGSIFLANQLGIKSSPKTGGVSSGISYVLIKNSGKKSIRTHEQIQAVGNSLVSAADIEEIIN